MTSDPTMEVTIDFTEEFKSLIHKLQFSLVKVGIPSSDDGRKDKSPIGNAGILFINEYGSPGMNIPPRPVLTNGIFIAQDELLQEFKAAAETSIDKGLGDQTANVGKHFERAGIIASSACKKVINDQIGIEGPAESTLKSRKSRGFNGNKALVVTGQMRNAITYIVEEA